MKIWLRVIPQEPEMEQGDRERTSKVDFEIEKYKIDRAHELELNRFTHVLEMERLKLLTVLNGGAAAAWLTFSKAGRASDGAWAAAALVVPPLMWLAGLILASVATHAAFKTQRAFTQAYHRRRRSDEWRLMRRSYGVEQISKILPRPEGKHDVSEEVAFGNSADEAVRAGTKTARQVLIWTFGSVSAFVLGALAAGALSLVVQTEQMGQPGGVVAIPSEGGGS